MYVCMYVCSWKYGLNKVQGQVRPGRKGLHKDKKRLGR